MSLNPYARFVAEQNPIEVIETTPRRLTDLAARLSPSSLDWRPAPGKWSVREILCHLADTEIVMAFRIRQTLAEDHHVIQPFDQERWAGQYGALGARAALGVFTAVREWNLALISSAPAEAMAKRVTHPERGEMMLATVVETLAGHDLNHLAQLDAIAAALA